MVHSQDTYYEINTDESDTSLTSDEELMQIIEKRSPKIKIFGTGGAGSNTITRLAREKIPGVELIACNTDAQHLLRTKANGKVLLGENLTRGLGSGANPLVGEEASKESEGEIIRRLKGSDLVFITAGLGGGTGTGSAPHIAKIAKSLGAVSISIVTLPFRSEGSGRMQNARWGLRKVINYSDTTIVIPNDKLLELVPKLSLQKAFRYADEIIVRAIKGIAELITKPGLINLDFNDLKSILKNSGMAMIGIGIGNGDPGARVRSAIQNALDFPFIKADLSTASGVIINITGGKDLQIQEASIASEMIKAVSNKSTKIILGINIDPSLESKVQVMLVVTGVSSEVINELLGGSGKDGDSGIDIVR